ncbi:MAG: ATP-binding cassette domain-containing protein [Spirochaetales bacterium]|nr:ATP-binding cassette domain-containing protein [Spirochaetales bacterium]
MMKANKNLIQIENVSKKYGNTFALKNINLEIFEGEFLCLLGPSGCGKSTLLRILAGLETNYDGKILKNGKEIDAIEPGKRKFGMVFQSYSLFPNMSVEKNIEFALKAFKYEKQKINAKIESVLELTNLLEHRKKFPNQLSGGQQQRVALARAIAPEPTVLLLDEPLSALDFKVREELRQQLKKIQRDIGVTTIMVTHDQEEALSLADRVAVMNHAELVQISTPEEIYRNPKSFFVANFIGTMNNIYNKFIRPEDVKISDKKGCNTHSGIVISNEFRGFYRRIKLKSEIENEKKEIIVDIPIFHHQDRSFNEGESIHFNLPQEVVSEQIKERIC